MELLIFPLLLLLLGTAISFFSKRFRLYWVFVVAIATVGAVSFQVLVYLQLGYLDPFYRAALVSSWLILFALASLAFLGYRALQNYKRRINGSD
jgi:hypothetical protein